MLNKIDMAQLSEATGTTTRKLTKGTGMLNIQFHGDTAGPDDVRAYGAAFIDDADLWHLPLIGELFKIVGGGEYKIGGLSDAEVVFRLWGSKMTIAGAHLSNAVNAIEAEHGGKVDLSNGQVEINVMAIPLKSVNKVIKEIPVVNWFVHLKNKIIRLQIKGHWSEPANKLIHKHPMKDVEEATLGFFVDVAKSSGNIVEGIKNGIGSRQADKNPKEK